MTSNGPVSWRRSLNSRVRVIVAAAISSSPCSTWTVLKPSFCRPRSDAPQVGVLAADHVVAEVAVGAARVARPADALRHVEHDRGRQHVVLARQRDQRAARVDLHVGRVDDGQPPRRQPLADDEVEQLERVGGGGLVVLVVGDQAAAEVGRDHLGRLEPLARERRLARAADADEDDEAQLRHPELGHGVTPWPAVTSSAGRIAAGDLVEDRHLGRRADLRVVPADGQEPHAVAVALGHRRRPSRETARGSTRSGGRGAAACPAAASRSGRCTRRSAW